jgi:polyphenol oxidase
LFAHRSSTGPVDLAFTDRYDGVSAVPFDSLNLALVGDDDPEAVRRNVSLLLDDFAPGATLADMHQVHGHTVVEAGGPREQCDALVTDRSDLVLMVRVADCVPVLLADPDQGVIGAAHAGRPGLVAEVVPHAVAAMRDLGATRIRAWVGPHVCGSCYEVPEQMRSEVAAVVPESYAVTSWGTPALDIGAGVLAQLGALDVEAVGGGGCTREDPDLWSHRRDGREAGRLGGLVRLVP